MGGRARGGASHELLQLHPKTARLIGFLQSRADNPILETQALK
jgi:hypothetical protein